MLDKMRDNLFDKLLDKIRDKHAVQDTLGTSRLLHEHKALSI